MPLSLAIVGDMHGQFDATDVEYFNASSYDALLMVGDLATKNPDSVFRLVPLLNQLTKPTYLIPGNHDTTGIRQLIGEITHNDFLVRFGAPSQSTRMEKFARLLATPTLCGYSIHNLGKLSLVAARPFSMGDSRASSVGDPFALPVNFKPYLEKIYGITTLYESKERLMSLIDRVNPPYIVLAHHGPFGLGEKATDMFGADFLPTETDFGDRDLSAAIDYAHKIKKPPLAVIAGHMHYPTKHGKKNKTWHLKKDGVLYINAARWPRIFKEGAKTVRHHISLTVDSGARIETEARYIS